jgi:hypothetical protein
MVVTTKISLDITTCLLGTKSLLVRTTDLTKLKTNKQKYFLAVLGDICTLSHSLEEHVAIYHKTLVRVREA